MSVPSITRHGETTTLAAIRGFLLALFLIGSFGAGTELLLIGHTEDSWQFAPLILMGISLLVLGWRLVDRQPVSLRAFQGTMILFVVGGLIGLWLHYQGRMEFKLEMNPALSGLELFWETITGATVPPTLAPGTMIELGLLGLAYTYRHPALMTLSRKKSDNQGETL